MGLFFLGLSCNGIVGPCILQNLQQWSRQNFLVSPTKNFRSLLIEVVSKIIQCMMSRSFPLREIWLFEVVGALGIIVVAKAPRGLSGL